MQGVIVSWVGHSCVLPRCSASSENKRRTRRTKEERRTMINSFIKKYQNSNNGKFPSLNLTHKEVGGSFYTIREIVRDIIQENKVLGPGSPSSKLLNLEYCLEEGEDNGSYLDVRRNKSVSAIVNGIDLVHDEVVSSLEQEISSDENIAADKPVPVVLSNTYLNEYSSWPLLQDELSIQENLSDGFVLHEEVAKTGTKESNVHVLTEKEEDASEGGHQINAEDQLNSPEDVCVQYTKQSVPLCPTSSGTSFIKTELKNGDMHNEIPVARRFLEDSTNISETDGTNISETAFAGRLRGTDIFFSDIVDDQSNFLLKHHNDEVFPLVTNNIDQDSSTEIPVPAVSNTSKISRSGHKGHLALGPFEEGVAINSSELENSGLNSTDIIFSTSESSSIANKGVIETMEIASFNERQVDLALGATKNDIDKSSSFDVAIKESENASSKLLKPIIEDADHAEVESEKQSVTSGTMNGVGFISSSNEKAMKESEGLQLNPMWAAIKSFVSSFIQFWSE